MNYKTKKKMESVIKQMKRTIKFRGYNKKNNKWIYGYYLVNRGQHFIVEDDIANPLNTWEDYLVEEDTIGQFTGLLDMGGVEYTKGILLELPTLMKNLKKLK